MSRERWSGSYEKESEGSSDSEKDSQEQKGVREARAQRMALWLCIGGPVTDVDAKYHEAGHVSFPGAPAATETACKRRSHNHRMAAASA